MGHIFEDIDPTELSKRVLSAVLRKYGCTPEVICLAMDAVQEGLLVTLEKEKKGVFKHNSVGQTIVFVSTAAINSFRKLRRCGFANRLDLDSEMLIRLEAKVDQSDADHPDSRVLDKLRAIVESMPVVAHEIVAIQLLAWDVAESQVSLLLDSEQVVKPLLEDTLPKYLRTFRSWIKSKKYSLGNERNLLRRGLHEHPVLPTSDLENARVVAKEIREQAINELKRRRPWGTSQPEPDARIAMSTLCDVDIASIIAAMVDLIKHANHHFRSANSRIVSSGRRDHLHRVNVSGSMPTPIVNNNEQA